MNKNKYLIKQAQEAFYKNDYNTSQMIYLSKYESDNNLWFYGLEAYRSSIYKEKFDNPSNIVDNCLMFAPNYSKRNSYQTNLYSQHKNLGYNICFLSNPTLNNIPSKFLIAKNKIFHQHWVKPFYYESINMEDGVTRINNYINILKIYKLFGVKILWTIHNLLDHDINDMQKQLNIYANKKISEISNKIYVFSKHSIEMLCKQINFDISNKCIVLEHPLYYDILNCISQIPPELNIKYLYGKTVLLHVGILKPYKGIVNLLKSFSLCSVNNLYLIIAGEIMDNNIIMTFENLPSNIRNKIVIIKRRISDAEIKGLMEIADVIVNPYNKILTSGSFYLNTTFKKPTIAPNIGFFPEIINDNVNGFLFDSNKNNLVDIIKKVSTLDKSYLANIGEKNFKLYSHLTPQFISQKFFNSI